VKVLHFVSRPENEDDAVGRQAFSPHRSGFLLANYTRRNQHPPQHAACLATLPESKARGSLLPRENLHSRFAADLACHSPLRSLHDEACDSTIVRKRLAIVPRAPLRPFEKESKVFEQQSRDIAALGLQANKNGGAQTSTPPHIYDLTYAADLLLFALVWAFVFESRFAASSFATAFWSFSASTR
jgi:hypothetical protein